jgi:transposase-like protein
MGRKSALTLEQWAAVQHRYIVGGESLNSLAKELGLNESSLRRKLGSKAVSSGETEDLRELAGRKAKVDIEAKQISREIEALPIAKQMIVSDLARKLAAISNHVASSAEYMAATSHRLSGIANSLMDKVDDADPMKSSDVLQKAAALIRLSNDAAHIPLNLLKANQSTIDAMNEGAQEGNSRPAAPVYQIIHE